MKTAISSVIFVLAFVAVAISSSVPTEKQPPDWARQLQKSSSLTAIRYINVFEAISPHKELDKTQKDLDWWIDLSILDLATLETNFPNIDWKNINYDDSGIVKFSRFYKQIANYRFSQPRLHDVSLNKEQTDAIQAFIEKYK